LEVGLLAELSAYKLCILDERRVSEVSSLAEPGVRENSRAIESGGAEVGDIFKARLIEACRIVKPGIGDGSPGHKFGFIKVDSIFEHYLFDSDIAQDDRIGNLYRRIDGDSTSRAFHVTPSAQIQISLDDDIIVLHRLPLLDLL